LLLTFAAALVLSAWGAWLTLATLARMPVARAALLFSTPNQQARYQAATTAALRAAPVRTRQAYVLQYVAGDRLLGAMRGRIDPYVVEQAALEADEDASQLGLAECVGLCARLVALEHEGADLEKWWYAAQPIVHRVEGAEFAHGQHGVEEALARGVASLRVAPGTARAITVQNLASPYGPFLQFFTTRLLFLADAREQLADAAGARQCRRLVLALLRQFVVEEGPSGPRLMAAGLLIESLDRAEPEAALRDRLRSSLGALRTQFRERVAHMPPNVLGLRDEAWLAPEAHRSAARALTLLACVAAATLGAGVFAVATCWVWMRAPAAVRVRSAFLSSLACGVIAVGVMWMASGTEAVQVELRGDWSSLRYWWWAAVVAGLGGLLLPVLCGLGLRSFSRADRAAAAQTGGRPQSGRSQHSAHVNSPPSWRMDMAMSGLFIWVTLAVVTVAASWNAQGALLRYEREVAGGYGAPLTRVLGNEADALLAPVHEWIP
jgi:hypothetical protein